MGEIKIVVSLRVVYFVGLFQTVSDVRSLLLFHSLVGLEVLFRLCLSDLGLVLLLLGRIVVLHSVFITIVGSYSLRLDRLFACGHTGKTRSCHRKFTVKGSFSLK